MASRNEAEIILKGKFENGKAIVDATKQIDKNLKDIGETSQAAEKNSSRLASTLKKLGAVVGVTYLTNSFKNLVKGSLNAAGSMEQVNIALTTMLGSGEKAAKLQKDLVEFAKKTPFEIEGIFSSTKQLLAYGIAQEDIIETMSTLGNIASGVGVDMNRLALAFGQVKTTGRLMGQDLNQFTQAGVPLLAALAENLGKSEAEVLALKESGQISFEQVKAALEGMTQEGGRFFNLMENQSKTFLGTVSNMSDSFYQVRVVLGQALLPVAKRVVDSMIIFFGNLQKSIEANQSTINNIANAFVGAFSLMGKAIVIVISIVKNFVAGIKQILRLPLIKEILGAAAAVLVFSKGMAVLTMAVRLFTTTAFGWISVIISVISAIGYLSKHIESMPNFLKVAVLTMGKWWEQLKFSVFSVIDSIIEKLKVLENIPGFGWVKDIRNDFAETKDSIIKNIDDINNALNSLGSPESQSVDVKQPDDITQTVTTKQLDAAATQSEDPQAKLKALQAEHAALLAEQQRYLGEVKTNEDNALELALENERLKNEQKLLSQGEYADRKRELDQMLLDDEIAIEDYKRELEQLNNEAKLETLQEQYDAEREKFIENQEMMNEIKNEMQLTQDEIELEMLQQKLHGIAQKQEVQNERLLAAKIKKDDQERKQEQKTGEFKLKFDKFMKSEEMKNAQKAASELVALQNSKNKELAAIGKAAAIFQITVDTASGAMSAYKALAPIPFVGPALGAAAAAAVIAYGAERIGNVKSASYAVGTPDIPQDHMAMVHAGEMIIPATFADAIRSGDLSLSGGNNNQEGATQANQQITITFEGANFYGRMEDEDIEEIGERLGEMIAENIITPIPTRRA